MPRGINLVIGAPPAPPVGTPTQLTPGPRSVGVVVPAPTVLITPSGGINVSGIPRPAVRSGYERVAATEFQNQQSAIGPPAPSTAAILRPRPNVAQDGTFTDSSGRGRYSWKHTTREWNGTLDIFLHSENAGQATRTHVPGGSINYCSAPLSNHASAVDMGNGIRPKAFDVHVIVKFPLANGYKCAFLLWNTGTNINGEDDWPEGKFDGGTPKGIAAHHYYGTGGQKVWGDVLTTGNGFQDWHLYTTRFHADGYRGHPTGYINFLLDGVKISSGAGETDRICPDGMWWVGQIETFLAGQPIPSPMPSGHVYIDWFAVDYLI
jgi:hypothetical protein